MVMLLLFVACAEPEAPARATADPAAVDTAPEDTPRDDTSPKRGDPCRWDTTFVDPGDAHWLFSDTNVVELSLELSAASVHRLRQLTDGGKDAVCGALRTPYGVIAPVQISLRGKVGNSFQPFDGKPYFGVDLTPSGVTLSGVTQFRLYNQWQDVSGLQRYLGYAMWRQVGYPAPRAGFAHLTVNGRDLGIVGTNESVDATMLSHWPDDFGTIDAIFEGEYGNDFDAPYALEALFGEAHRPRLDALATVVEDSEDLATDLAPFMDTELWYRHWALEVAVGAREGYSFEQNNYYVVYDAGADRFTMIPWGFDQVLYDHVGTDDTQGLLPTRGMTQATYSQEQCDVLGVVNEEIRWDVLRDELDALDARIPSDYVIAGLDQATPDEVAAIRTQVADYLDTRHDELAAWHRAGCPLRGRTPRAGLRRP